MANPSCPECSRTMMKNGQVQGHQRYRCKCGHSYTDGPNTHGGHRHGVEGGTSQTERTRKYRAKRKAAQSPE